MMKMDERDRAECQNWEMKGRDGHYGILFKSLKDKTWHSVFSFIKPRGKNVGKGKIQPVADFLKF